MSFALSKTTSRPLALSLLALCQMGNGASAAGTEGVEFFEKKIRPILVERCYECHSTEKKQKGGLAVDSREGLLHGGDSGAALVPGDLEKSKLIEGVRWKNLDFQMPPKKPLAPQEIADLEAWVKMGAPDPREKTAAVSRRVIDVNEGRKFWSFQPLTDPVVPKVRDTAWVKSPVDAFVLAKLDSAGLRPAPATDRRTLIRRATFDLIGLPPTPEEVEDFVKDESADAFAKVVERLLKSPAYGERWGRHWLDVARYADSNGMDENVAYGHAWRYRDYVVQAFNEDRPFDTFLVEQIAGDLLPASSQADRVRNLTATGFLALGGKVLAEPDVKKLQMDVIDEQIDTMGKAFLGMTLGCCRCHDHKFDPVPTTDYYALAAIFRSTKSLGDDTTGAIKYWYEHSFATPEQQAAKKTRDAKVTAARKKVTDFVAASKGKLKDELQSHAADYLAASAILDADAPFPEVEKLAREKSLRPRYLLTCRQFLARNPQHPFFAAWREMVESGKPNEIAAHYAPLFADALAAMKELKATNPKATKLDDPRLAPALDALNDVAGFLAIPDKDADAFDPEWAAKVEQMNTEVAKLESDAPDLPAVMGVADGTITPTLPVHIRGSTLTLGQPVSRGFPEVMRASLAKPIFPSKQSGRLELARWMASSGHPLTARVFVNRVWRWHFGKGIVASTDNFGTLGDKPSHPELLDWLARRFIEDGWSVKALHRLIMNSSAYQQGSSIADGGLRIADSAPSPNAAIGLGDNPQSAIRNQQLIDPENRLLWRFNIQRLEAEQIRDALFAESGALDRTGGGKTIPLRDKEFVFNHTSKDRTTYESPRRALYLPVIRNHLYDMLEQFDYPDPTMTTGSRNSTVVAPQALLMMNSGVVMESADCLAAKLLAIPSDDSERIRQAFLTVFSRMPEARETERALASLAELQREVGAQASGDDASRKRAWSLYCQTLMATNEFMYLR